MLREERRAQSRCGRQSLLARRVFASVAAAAAIAVLAVGITVNWQYADAEKLAAAKADYATAVTVLTAAYNDTRAAAKALGSAVRNASSLVTTATGVSDSVNGYVDAAALSALAAHTQQLADTVGTSEGDASRNLGHPQTTEEYRQAAVLARLQAERNRSVRRQAVASTKTVETAAALTRQDMAAVAASVSPVAQLLVDANSEAKRAVKAELTQAASNVQTALDTGGDLPEVLTAYGACARAVTDSAAEESGETPVMVATVIQVPQVPAKVNVIAAGIPPAPAKTAPSVASPPTPAPAATSPAPTQQAPTTQPAPPPFTLTVNAQGRNEAGCAQKMPVGAGLAYGQVGTTRTVSLNYSFRYDYQVTQVSPTAAAWTAYMCRDSNAGGNGQR